MGEINAAFEVGICGARVRERIGSVGRPNGKTGGRAKGADTFFWAAAPFEGSVLVMKRA
jgi:hypothetical protein